MKLLIRQNLTSLIILEKWIRPVYNIQSNNLTSNAILEAEIKANWIPWLRKNRNKFHIFPFYDFFWRGGGMGWKYSVFNLIILISLTSFWSWIDDSVSPLPGLDLCIESGSLWHLTSQNCCVELDHWFSDNSHRHLIQQN